MGTETVNFGIASGEDLGWIRQVRINRRRNGSGRFGQST